jgi:hypothetical protein
VCIHCLVFCLFDVTYAAARDWHFTCEEHSREAQAGRASSGSKLGEKQLVCISIVVRCIYVFILHLSKLYIHILLHWFRVIATQVRSSVWSCIYIVE